MMCFIMVLGKVIARSGYQCSIMWPCLTWSHTQKYFISVVCEYCFLMVSLAVPTVVAPLQWLGIERWGCPSSCKISLMILHSFTFKKRAASSASAADAATSLRITHRLRIVPMRRMGSLGVRSQPRKKCPAAQLRALVMERYDASECVLRIMSEAK